MEPSAQWKELNKRFYKFHHYNPITGEQKSLDFFFARVAVAQWGGPLAATKNTELINIMKSEDILKDAIVFFSNSGKIINRIQYKEYEKIVLFQFLEEEQLIVLKSNGSYNLFDPFKGTKKFFDLVDTFKSDNIVRGVAVGNGFVVQTANFEFYNIPNAFEPQVHKMKNAGLIGQPDHWIAIPANKSQSGKVEVQVTNSEGGIIHIIEDEKRKVYYNRDKIENEIDKKLPDIKNIKMISVSPSFKFIAYLSFINQEWILSVLSDDFEASKFFQIRVDLREDDQKQDGPQKDRSILERPQHMYWCGDDCVVLQLVQSIILVGPDAYVRVKMNNQHFILKPEIDGLRLISQKKNEILRRLPDSFINVYQPLSTLPGAMLNTAYESFEQKNPIEDDELRSKKTELAQGVMDCIKSGQFEVTPEYQTKLLKAASYGKTFLGNQAIDPNLLSETCRYLRVVNALRRSGGVGGRVLTYDQVFQLTKLPQLFVQLLLRYNLHYLAIEVAKYLKFPIKFKSQIYTHWACCKVETQVDDDQLCLLIKDKIKEEKGVSFTEIAHRAIEVGKSQLALKLLDNEPSLAKRIPVLLWMANYQQGTNNSYYEKALNDAISSRDSNLIYLVIMKFLRNDMDETYKFGILSQNPITQQHLVTYLRNFDDKYLQKYLQYLKRFDECGLLAITQAYQQDNIADKIKFLEFAQKFFEEDSKDSFYGKILQEQISSLKDLKSELDKEKKKPNKKIMEEKSLNQILETFLLKDDLKLAQEFAKVYKIPERRYLMTRVKTLIQNKNFEELDRMMAEKNKKTIIIPYELVADMLIRSGQEEKGLQIIMKMPDIEEQVYLLIKIGQPKYAAQSAINQKKTQLLYEIRGSIQDPQVLAIIDAYLSQNPK